jgi:hypothetical protein
LLRAACNLEIERAISCHPTHNITRYLNKTVFVSIPALFEDGACRPFKLLGVEIYGLWLQSDELTQRLLPTTDRISRLWTKVKIEAL